MSAPGVLSAGVVVVRLEAAGPRYLLLRAYDYWDFPKGEVEPGEAPLDAAVREVAEETTIDDLRFTWGRDYVETPPYGPRRKVARYYLAESPAAPVHLPVNDELGRPEHDEFRWLGRGEAEALLRARVARVLAWADARVHGASR